MKKLLFIALLLPLGLMAQKDSGTIYFHTGYLYSTVKPDTPYLALKNLSYPIYKEGTEWKFKNAPLTLKVYDNTANPISPKILMETDTSGNIHVYGDTLSVLKAIIKSYHIKLKD